jgi:CPA2 family monovalent cation:H+ antiporter-2
MVLSESDYGHQALSDIIPVRDIFGLLFFTSVGMLLDPAFLMIHWETVLLLVLLVALGKGLIFGFLALLFGYGNVVPLAVGLGLFQVGEFSFVLARVGLSTESISRDVYSLMLSVTLVSMILTPLVSGLTTPLYSIRRRWFKHEPLQTINLPDAPLKDHVVIAGAGRIGQHVARVLQQMGLSFVLIELDYRVVEERKAAGFPVIFGDASQEVVLEAASIHMSCLLLITTPALVVARSIVEKSRELNPKLEIVARSSGVDQMQTLFELGATEVVLPEFEAGLEMTRQALAHLHVPTAEVLRYSDAVRRELYAPLRDVDADLKDILFLQTARDLLELNWVLLSQESPLRGRTLGELGVRSRVGVSVVGILRQGTFHANPSPEFRFEAGDMVGAIGTLEEFGAFENWAVPPRGA